MKSAVGNKLLDHRRQMASFLGIYLFMTLMSVSFVLRVCARSGVEDLNTQERLFLNSLGLSGRPKAASRQHRRVPSMLWGMFGRSTSTDNNEARDSDACMVSEYGVRGNIIRYVQDQGNLYVCLFEITSVWSHL